MKNKPIPNIHERIQNDKRAKDQRVNDLHEKLAAAEEEKIEAAETAKTAINAGNLDAYHAAKDNERAAIDRAEFYTAQIKREKAQQLYDPEERKAAADEIKTSLEDIEAVYLAKVAPLINKAVEYIDEVVNEYGRAEKSYQAIGSSKDMFNDRMYVMGLSNLLTQAKKNTKIKELI